MVLGDYGMTADGNHGGGTDDEVGAALLYSSTLEGARGQFSTSPDRVSHVKKGLLAEAASPPRRTKSTSSRRWPCSSAPVPYCSLGEISPRSSTPACRARARRRRRRRARRRIDSGAPQAQRGARANAAQVGRHVAHGRHCAHAPVAPHTCPAGRRGLSPRLAPPAAVVPNTRWATQVPGDLLVARVEHSFCGHVSVQPPLQAALNSFSASLASSDDEAAGAPPPCSAPTSRTSATCAAAFGPRSPPAMALGVAVLCAAATAATLLAITMCIESGQKQMLGARARARCPCQCLWALIGAEAFITLALYADSSSSSSTDEYYARIETPLAAPGGAMCACVRLCVDSVSRPVDGVRRVAPGRRRPSLAGGSLPMLPTSPPPNSCVPLAAAKTLPLRCARHPAVRAREVLTPPTPPLLTSARAVRRAGRCHLALRRATEQLVHRHERNVLRFLATSVTVIIVRGAVAHRAFFPPSGAARLSLAALIGGRLLEAYRACDAVDKQMPLATRSTASEPSNVTLWTALLPLSCSARRLARAAASRRRRCQSSRESRADSRARAAAAPPATVPSRR